jgi:phosphotriesterase-related protein
MTKLITTLGSKPETEFGMILPHEHIFVDFRSPDHPEHGLAEVTLMQWR